MMALIYLSASVGAFYSPDYYSRITDDLFSNAGLVYLAGFITVIFGLLIVNYHNRWVKNWTVLITIFGWIGLLKGLALIACPQGMQSLSGQMTAGSGSKFFPYAALCLGLLFTYFGFVSKSVSSDPSSS
jgi:hypothetical protein